MENLDLGMKKQGSEFLNANGKPGFGDKKLRFQNQEGGFSYLQEKHEVFSTLQKKEAGFMYLQKEQEGVSGLDSEI